MAARLTKKRDAQRSRNKILLTAENLFAELGPGASIDLVARQSGLNKRMIYHYFRSKEGLWRAVLVRQYEKAAAVEASLPHGDPPAQIVSELVSRYCRFLAGDMNFVKILMHENLRGGQSIRKLPVAQTKAPVLQALEKALGSTKRPGMDPSDLLIDCLALCFFYFSNQTTLSSLLGRNLSNPANIDHRIRHLRRIVSRIV